MQFLYFANPMCSWCWGFSPIIRKIKADYTVERLRLVLTPFRIHTSEPMDSILRDYVLGQWKNVHARTGQEFDFSFKVPNDFIYNTQLVCQGIKAFHQQLPETELEFLHSLQRAFYTKNKNITDENVLIDLADKFAIDIDLFMQDLHSSAVDKLLKQDFDMCLECAVQSYPTLSLETNEGIYDLTRGYAPYSIIKAKVDDLLAT